MKNLALVAITLAAFTQSAHADHASNGARYMGGGNYALPADAHNVKIAQTSVEEIATGETNCRSDNEGNFCDTVYTSMLNVKVTYDSKDDTDQQTELDRSGEGSVVVGGPAVTLSLLVSSAQIDAIRVGLLDGASLVGTAVKVQNVNFADETYGPDCRFNNDSGGVNNPECIIHSTVSESRPVLSVFLK